MEIEDLVKNYNMNDLILLDTVNYSDEYPSLLIKSIMTNNDPLSKVLIKNNISLLRRNSNNMSAFLIAISKNNLYIAKKIYKRIKNIDDSDINGTTGLMIASKYGYIDIVKFLLENGANINHQNKRKQTALIYATIHNNQLIVEELLKNHVNYNQKDINNSTALIYAVRNDNDIIVDLLLNCKYIDIDVVDNNNYTARMYAICLGCNTILNKINNIYANREDGETLINTIDFIYDKCVVSFTKFINMCNTRID